MIISWPELTSECKPWTRWWWLGSSVDRSNIADLLRRYAAAGIGGVEITPIYGVIGDEANEVPYLSPEWGKLLQFTISEARSLGMQVDMPTGTGWPFGGPQVSDTSALDKLHIDHSVVSSGIPFRLNAPDESVLSVTAYGAEGQIIRLDDKVEGDGSIDWEVPDGPPWQLYTASLTWGGRSVKRAAPGGEGKCINPFDKASLQSYLNRFDEALSGLEPGALRCHFHDSFEYLADFSSGFFEEFRQRHGYDLACHLDALSGDIDDQDRIVRVKTDYRATISEMLLENFTQSWTQWAHSKGSLSRNQAHGSPGNLLDLYGTPDIPETETFGGVGDPIVNKFASSAAHLMGRKYCSSESCTWLGEHFNVTLAQCKDGIDGLFVSGINHIFFHGTAYSPITDPWPGRLFYASTSFAPQDPLWKDLPALNAYIARCQSILQSGRPDNDILVYWPLSDLWMTRPDVYMLEIEGRWMEGQPFAELARGLWSKGYQFDYVSDRQLNVLAEGGALGDYKAVLVPSCRYIAPETLESLYRLTEAGIAVVFVDGAPSDVPGYGDLKRRREHLSEAMGRLNPQTKIVAREHLAKHLGSLNVRRESMADVEGVQIIRRRSEFGTDYFVTNRGVLTIDGWAALAAPRGSVLLMDPMTGDIGVAESRYDGGQWEVRLQLLAGQSIVVRVVEDNEVSDTTQWNYRVQKSDPFEISGDWTVDFLEGGPDCPASVSAHGLGSWTDLDVAGAEVFAGTVRYTICFDAPDSAAENWLLELGEVADSARVILNGRDLGTLISPPFRLEAGGLLRTGNVLEVCVTNVAANRIRGMDRRGEKWRIFKEINFVNRQYQAFDASDWDVRSAGLLGPVTLLPIDAS